MTWLLEWTYKRKRHFDSARDKRLAMRMKKNIPFAFPGATGIKMTEAQEPSYADIRRLERAMGIRQ